MLADCQLACKITQGEHKVKLRFEPQGLLYGVIITVGAYTALGAYLVYRKLRKRKSKTTDGAIVENV